jgi:hypothetical protein
MRWRSSRSTHFFNLFLALFQAFSGVNFFGTQAAIKTLLTMLLEYSVIHGCFNACFFGCSCQMFVVLGQFVADRQAFFVFREICKWSAVL